MASLASLVSLGSACTCSSGQFEGSLSLVRKVSLSRNFGSFQRVWVGKRWRYVSICKYSVTTDYIADQGTSVSLDSTYRGSKEDGADLNLKPAPKPVLKSGPKVDPLLGMNSVTWNPSKLSGDSENEKLNGEEEERNMVIESLGEVLEKAEKLETSKKATASVRKPPTPNTSTDQRNGRPVNTTTVRKSKTLKSVWRKGNPVATVQKVVKELPKNEKVKEPNIDVVAKIDSPSVAPLRPPQPPQRVQPKLQMKPSVAPPPPMIKKPVILKDVGAATKSPATVGTNSDAKTPQSLLSVFLFRFLINPNRIKERKGMASVSMTWSLPANHRRVNRTTRMSIASGNKAGVQLTQGLGNLPKVVLTSSHGSEAELYLFGGCITSWKVASKDLLFVRPDAVFNGQKPISGGVPHCFPQFGPGEMQQHGFARNVNWSILDSENVEGNPVITLELRDDTYSRSMWDFSFQALYKVTLDKKSLSTELIVTNNDAKRFSFTTALHTYFSASVAGASVKGLKGCKTLNKYPDPKNPVEGKEERDAVTFPGFVDCIYLEAPSELQLDNGLGDVISIRNTNWTDTVLWNPHLTMEACYKDFVCVENAKIGEVQLEPKQSWTATQHLSID